MVHGILARAAIVMLAMTILFQVGCAGRSRPARFYVLSPVAGTESESRFSSGGAGDMTIGISRVSLPRYLRKPQIVTRTGSNELHLAEYERWAGKMDEDVGRVIAENLSHTLATDRVLSYPAMEEVEPDYTIKMDIIRFEGVLGGDVELIVRWAIFDGAGNTVYGVNGTRIIEPTEGGSYGDLVGAQSRALAAFSRELAAVIKKLAAT